MSLRPVVINQDIPAKPLAYVLDDERDIGMVVCRMLGALGFATLPFIEADECVRQIEAAAPYAKPGLILLDLALGKTDAVEVFERLAALPFKGKVLLISGSDLNTLNEIQAIGTSRGLSMLPPLKKPFRIAELKESLKAAVLGTGTPTAASDARKDSGDSDKLPANFIERALMNDELHLWYDAKINLKTGGICGAEAVLYSQHPSRGWVSVAGAVPPADSPIHHPLMRFIIRRLASDWTLHLERSSSALKLSTKLPLPVVTSRAFMQFVRDLLPVSPNFLGLILEATDWRTFNDDKALREASARLSLYRIGLSVDDIGAVYSSVANDRAFPYAEIKLAGGLLNEANRAVCQDAIDLAHRAGASVCAVVTTNSNSLSALKDMGCDTVQLGDPKPVSALKQKLLIPESTRTESALVASDDPYAWPTNVGS